jgi:hypothetical protein
MNWKKGEWGLRPQLGVEPLHPVLSLVASYNLAAKLVVRTLSPHYGQIGKDW